MNSQKRIPVWKKYEDWQSLVDDGSALGQDRIGWMEQDQRRCRRHSELSLNLEVDLHGHRIADAVTVTYQRLKDAYRNGFDYVTLIHGAPEIRSHEDADILARGRIKWRLREEFDGGRFDQWIVERQCAFHTLFHGAMRLKLKTNPTPSAKPAWGEVPERYYSIDQSNVSIANK